jgi:hypothetical protein
MTNEPYKICRAEVTHKEDYEWWIWEGVEEVSVSYSSTRINPVISHKS